MSYSTQRTFADRYMPYVKAILGQRIIDVASFEQDTTEATDLVVLRAKNLAIACRVRDMNECKKHFAHTKYQFTIRAQTSQNNPTEIHKIATGFGDWMFYGWSHEDHAVLRLSRWMIVDLEAFRYHMIVNRRELESSGAIQDKDGQGIPVPGGNRLWAFDVTLFPPAPKLLLDCSFAGELKPQEQLALQSGA